MRLQIKVLLPPLSTCHVVGAPIEASTEASLVVSSFDPGGELRGPEFPKALVGLTPSLEIFFRRRQLQSSCPAYIRDDLTLGQVGVVRGGQDVGNPGLYMLF